MRDKVLISDERFRLARLAQGQSQEELARAAHVTRQAISGIESGRWSPSLDVALSLARALDTSVEELFGSPLDAMPVHTKLIPSDLRRPQIAADGGRVLFSEINGDAVAFPLAGDNSLVPGFLPAAGILEGADLADTGLSHRIAEAVPTLAIAGCDPAINLLKGPLARRKPRLDLLWWPCGNASAADLLATGAVHAAALHRPVGVRNRPRRGVEVVGFASWREGLAVAPRLRGQVSGLADFASGRLRIANREPGSEARRLLDEKLEQLGANPADVAGYDTVCTAHLLVASAIAAGLADGGVTAEPAALAFGLTFIPWQEEITEFHIPRSHMAGAEVRALLEVLGGAELLRQLASLDGYDASPCGKLANAGSA
jgi:molybdate-binding protein/transcriptional regulator with XRE-family HTH domain